MSPQAFATLQQKQQAGNQELAKQGGASQQQKQIQQQQQQQPRVIVGNTAILSQSGATIAGKNIILQRANAHASNSNASGVQNSSTQGLTTCKISTITSAIGGAGCGGPKMQTVSTANLTPQQQRVLLQNLKQQKQNQQQQKQQQHQQHIQYETVQVVANPLLPNSQKPSQQQPESHIQYKTLQVVAANSPSQQQQQQQKQQDGEKQQTTSQVARSQAITIVPPRSNVASILQSAKQQQTSQQLSGKTVTVVVSQPQGLTRILKAASSNNQVTLSPSFTANPSTATKVINSSSGQIISLDSLMQNQSGATFKIANNAGITYSGGTTVGRAGNVKTSQPTSSIMQLAVTQEKGQFAVVPQQRNVVSLATPHRLISTTQGVAVTSDSVVATPKGSNTGVGNAIAISQTGKIIGKVSGNATAAGNIRVIKNTGGTPTRLNIANIQGKPVVFTTKPGVATAANVKNANTAQQQQQQQQPQNTNTVIIGGQAVKIQGNANVQQLTKNAGSLGTTPASTQMQTVIMGNQILRVQQLPQTLTKVSQQQQQQQQPHQQQQQQQVVIPGVASTASLTTSVANLKTNKIVNSNEALLNSNPTGGNAPKTLVLGPSGQTIRLQSATTQQQGSLATAAKNFVITPPQGTSAKTVAPSSRVVLAVQGGGQIFLSPSFQGNSLNLKSLQNMKVVSLSQTQQQTSSTAGSVPQTEKTIQTAATTIKTLSGSPLSRLTQQQSMLKSGGSVESTGGS